LSPYSSKKALSEADNAPLKTDRLEPRLRELSFGCLSAALESILRFHVRFHPSCQGTHGAHRLTEFFLRDA